MHGVSPAPTTLTRCAESGPRPICSLRPWWRTSRRGALATTPAPDRVTRPASGAARADLCSLGFKTPPRLPLRLPRRTSQCFPPLPPRVQLLLAFHMFQNVRGAFAAHAGDAPEGARPIFNQYFAPASAMSCCCSPSGGAARPSHRFGDRAIACPHPPNQGRTAATSASPPAVMLLRALSCCNCSSMALETWLRYHAKLATGLVGDVPKQLRVCMCNTERCDKRCV